MAARTACGTFCGSAELVMVVDVFTRRLPWLSDGVRPIRLCKLSLLSLGISCRVSMLGSMMPGPTDLRGARAAGFGGA